MNRLKYAVHKATGKRVIVLMEREVLGITEHLIIVEGVCVREDVKEADELLQNLPKDTHEAFIKGFLSARNKGFWFDDSSLEMVTDGK